ncbi:MAG TPA: hypothetical protein VMU00_04585 [Steroidobacteraceae bacterium]|nr:hypothetical protein [Steroidobacteraceae bacterium]
MDLKLIEEKQVVERYLRGRLTPPEARFFEQVVRQSPEIVERIGLPETLKRMMRLMDDTGTEWREQPPKFWHPPWVPASLAAALGLALIVALVAWSTKRSAVDSYQRLKTQVAIGVLNAPTSAQVLRLKPARAEERIPTYPIGGRVAPTLAELRINVGYVQATLFKVTIKRDDGAYFARLDNQLKDSNGDLRLGFNSGAFAAGVYDVELETVNLRGGEGELVGRLRLRVDGG